MTLSSLSSIDVGLLFGLVISLRRDYPYVVNGVISVNYNQR